MQEQRYAAAVSEIRLQSANFHYIETTHRWRTFVFPYTMNGIMHEGDGDGQQSGRCLCILDEVCCRTRAFDRLPTRPTSLFDFVPGLRRIQLPAKLAAPANHATIAPKKYIKKKTQPTTSHTRDSSSILRGELSHRPNFARNT